MSFFISDQSCRWLLGEEGEVWGLIFPRGAEGSQHRCGRTRPLPPTVWSVLLLSWRNCVETCCFCGCTDGFHSFIHKGYSYFDLALHVQHMSDWGSREVGAKQDFSPADTLTHTSAAFWHSSAPRGSMGFLLCMSVISSTVNLPDAGTAWTDVVFGCEGRDCPLYQSNTAHILKKSQL